MTYLINNFERVEGGELIRVGSQSNVKRESKIYIMNKKGNEEGGICTNLMDKK